MKCEESMYSTYMLCKLQKALDVINNVLDESNGDGWEDLQQVSERFSLVINMSLKMQFGQIVFNPP